MALYWIKTMKSNKKQLKFTILAIMKLIAANVRVIGYL